MEPQGILAELQRVHDVLFKQIREAFPDRCPPERPVTSHRCSECDEADALLAGRLWSDVATDFPAHCYDVFPLLTLAAQKYYLPAYMIVALTPEGGFQASCVESALKDTQIDPASFTPAQRHTVLTWASEYRRLMGDDGPPLEIAERWKANEE